MKSAALLFQWPHRHRIHLVLPAMLILAALAHSGIFFLFSVSNPTVKADGLHPARVYFLGQGSPELAQLETTLASNDPSLFAPLRRTPDFSGSSAAYVPQYASSKTALLNMPPRARTSEAKATPSGAVTITIPKRTSPPSSGQLDSNRLTSTSELADRLPLPPDDILVPKDSHDSLDAPTFFVGLRGDGSVAHIVTERSSGNADIDLRAMQILKSLRFLPAENLPLAWGFVDFHLGTRSVPDQP